MLTKTCNFIEVSSIFRLNNALMKPCTLAWDVFVNSDPKCTWGDNNRSLVTPDVIIDALENSDFDENAKDQVEEVLQRLKSIEPNIYIDLEN